MSYKGNSMVLRTKIIEQSQWWKECHVIIINQFKQIIHWHLSSHSMVLPTIFTAAHKSNQKEYQNTCTLNQILDTKKVKKIDQQTRVTAINLNHIFYINESTEVESSNPVNGEVYSIQHNVMKFVSDFRQVGGLLQVLRFPPPIKLTTTI
jgi:hypothetical protein